MSHFANLMALSATQTKQSQSAVEIALRERQRKETLRRKQQEEQEAKEREMENKRRLKLFEDQKRELERQIKLEGTKKAREAEQQRREDEQRDALRYGPKKAAKMASSSAASRSSVEPKWPSSSSARDASRSKQRHCDGSGDESPTVVLTREELRQKKQQAELKKLYNAAKRTSSHSNGYHKAGRRLPGGAVDIMTTSQSAAAQSDSNHKSVKDRLAAMPNFLTKLNTNKRDTRTIDEIVQDRAKAKEGKVLKGDDALEFDDWFGTKKQQKKTASPPVRPAPAAPMTSSGAAIPSINAVSAQKKATAPSKPAPIAKSSAISAKAASSSSTTASRSSNMFRNNTLPEKQKPHAPKNTKPNGYHSSKVSSSAVHARKRPRSISRSESPLPQRKRRRSEELDDELRKDYSSAIWQIFGRDRKQYVSRDVFSDEEDMEADATILEKEERMSSRMAAREEHLALEAERKHEEEKRRRKNERERAFAASRGGA